MPVLNVDGSEWGIAGKLTALARLGLNHMNIRPIRYIQKVEAFEPERKGTLASSSTYTIWNGK